MASSLQSLATNLRCNLSQHCLPSKLRGFGFFAATAQQPTHGKCQKECRTIEATCEHVLDKADVEFTEILYNAVKDGSSLADTQRYICNRAAGVCKKKAPKLTSRAFDEKFRPMTADEKQMQDMQANLKDSGMSGTMYRREDLAGMMEKMEGMGLGPGEGGPPPEGDADEADGASGEKDEM